MKRKNVLIAAIIAATIGLLIATIAQTNARHSQEFQKIQNEKLEQKHQLEDSIKQLNQDLEKSRDDNKKLQDQNKDLENQLSIKKKRDAALAAARAQSQSVRPADIHAPVVSSSGSCELAYKYSWPAKTAYGICMAESSGVASKVNWGDNHGSCSGSFGLMQNGCFWAPFFGYSVGQLYDPATNMEVAFKIWQRAGNFNAWTTYTSGKYLRYI